ncbi:hypothetical protein [Yinghuangia soli]|uniref:Uncharacterized protein n=1 Tax=Yinghuangia soli TaxID=2908204 RepID=A0AA41U3G9_9ACTN|nr:hypothetical protein [Yinghuangia soli]MCF2529697.1 hypothetical protein [Yinghuangia soli]
MSIREPQNRPGTRASGRRLRTLGVIACSLAVLTTGVACGGDSGGKDDAAEQKTSGVPAASPTAEPSGAPSAAGSPSPSATVSASPTSGTRWPCVAITATGKPPRGTLTREDLRNASTDPKPLTGDEVFGVASVPYKYKNSTLTRACVKVIETCEPVAVDKVAAMLKQQGCQRVVSALYVDKANNVQVSVSVMQMPTATAAATIKVDVDSDKISPNFATVAAPADSGATTRTDDTTYLDLTSSLYRYAIYERSYRADSQPMADGDSDKLIAAINAIYHVAGDAIDRRSDGKP